MAIAFGFGHFGSFFSPYIANLSIGINPVIILGIIGFLCSNTAFILKETLNK
jgi:hypothetical protein